MEGVVGAGALVLDRLAVHVAEDELQELPDAVQVAAMDAADDPGRSRDGAGSAAAGTAASAARVRPARMV